jgi:hypothetical protein
LFLENKRITLVHGVSKMPSSRTGGAYSYDVTLNIEGWNVVTAALTGNGVLHRVSQVTGNDNVKPVTP